MHERVVPNNVSSHLECTELNKKKPGLAARILPGCNDAINPDANEIMEVTQSTAHLFIDKARTQTLTSRGSDRILSYLGRLGHAQCVITSSQPCDTTVY